MLIKTQLNEDTVIGAFFIESSLDEGEIRSVKKLSKDRVVMEAVLQDAETLNRNRRRYRKKAIEEAIAKPYIQEKLVTNSLLGEANHPDANAPISRRMLIDINNVSHVIKSLNWEGNTLVGKVETAGTTVGRNFAGLILENGMQASFSMRGSGEYKVARDGTVDVTGPLDIRTWDAVQFPSHKVAYMRTVLNESATMQDIRVRDLARYIGEQSDKHGYVAEDVFFIGKDLLDYELSEGKVIIKNKATGKPLGWQQLNESLSNEYMDALSRIL